MQKIIFNHVIHKQHITHTCTRECKWERGEFHSNQHIRSNQGRVFFTPPRDGLSGITISLSVWKSILNDDRLSLSLSHFDDSETVLLSVHTDGTGSTYNECNLRIQGGSYINPAFLFKLQFAGSFGNVLHRISRLRGQLSTTPCLYA